MPVNAAECEALYPHDPTSARRPQFALQRSIGDWPLYEAREPIHHHVGQKDGSERLACSLHALAGGFFPPNDRLIARKRRTTAGMGGEPVGFGNARDN